MMRWLLVCAALLLAGPAEAVTFCGLFKTPCWTTGARPSSPGIGTTGFNTTLASIEWWNGSAWAQAASPLALTAGTYSAPSLSVRSSTIGIYSPAANTLGFTTNASGAAGTFVPNGVVMDQFGQIISGNLTNPSGNQTHFVTVSARSGATASNLLPLSTFEYNSFNSSIEPIWFGRSRSGTIGGTGVVLAGDDIQILQSVGDSGRGLAFNDVASNLEFKVSSIGAISLGIVPGQVQIKNTDAAGATQVNAIFEYDGRVNLANSHFNITGANGNLDSDGTGKFRGSLLTLQNTALQVLDLQNSTANGASTSIGQVKFTATSSTNVNRTYADLSGQIVTNTNGAEDGRIFFSTIVAGAASTEIGRVDKNGIQSTRGLISAGRTFANLPATTAGTMVYMTDGAAGNCGDGTCTTFGTTVTGGGGALKLLVWYNNANWTLIGK